MKVILRKNYEGLGEIGKVVDVRDGYARNFLIPQKVAYPYAPGYIKMIENEKRAYEARVNREIQDAKVFAEKLNGVELTIEVQAGEEDKLFGSVTNMDIAEALKAEGHDIDKKKIHIDEPIKRLGAFTAEVKLPQDITAAIKINVVQE